MGVFIRRNFRPARCWSFTQHFNTVELNNSFYQLPSVKSFETWRETTPDRFGFAVKGSRFITHMKKLKDPKPATEKFFADAEKLERKLGPVLFQLPPRWRVYPERLSTFLEVLPREHRYAFEFREHSWFTEEVYRLLRQHNAGLCIYHMTGYDSPHEVTADFVYLRFHGAESTYFGSYSDDTLRSWARRIKTWQSQSKDVYVYFNNDPEGHAVKNAIANGNRQRIASRRCIAFPK